MAVILVLPADTIEAELATFLAARVRSYFKTEHISVYCVGANEECYPQACGVSAVCPLTMLTPSFDGIAVSVLEKDGSLATVPAASKASLGYYIDRMGRIFSRETEITRDEYPELETHVFNRLGPRGAGNTFYYYPYGYLFRDNSVGHIDSLGFRVPDDLSFLEGRPVSHKLAIVYGGSAAFSMYSTREEMFPTVAEKIINTALQKYGKGERVTVLNYGMHGNVLMNEILNFVLYCHKLKPDVVIAHDGWNDFAYGLMSDPHLLDKWQVAYQYNLENWSQLVHATFKRPVNQPGSPFEPRNLPFSVLRAYAYRKDQFAEMVKAAGAQFIPALQPCVYNKATLSPFEADRIDLRAHGMDCFSKVYPRIKTLYDTYLASVRADAPENFVDLPAVFSRYDEKTTLFADHVHTMPKGDHVIADVYAESLMPLLFGKQMTRPEDGPHAA
ncbi:MAG: hypothetical protein KKF77_14375 [Proteobacteria bacterium]|nr:hypothetical protein [Pseudomonadota bacterium]